MFARYIAVSVLEYEDRRFVDLEGEVGLRGRERVINIRLDVRKEETIGKLNTIVRQRRRNGSTDFFSCANASIDLVDKPSADHFVEDDPGARIQHLFICGSVRPTFEVCVLAWTLPIYADTQVIWLIDF